MDIYKTGKFIAEKRKEQGLTQKALAEKVGVTDKAISKWERGCLIRIFLCCCPWQNV